MRARMRARAPALPVIRGLCPTNIAIAGATLLVILFMMTNESQVTQIMTRESLSQELVAKCQSPRFTGEAERLAVELGS